MKKMLLATSLASLVAFSSASQAESGNRNFGEIYTDCGLGALIAQGLEDQSTADIVAIVTNVTWDLGTTAISSNWTTAENCARGSAKTAAFILKSYGQLEKELALGNGRYLDALTDIAQIAPEDKQTFAQAIRAEFAKQTASSAYELLSRKEKAELLYNIVTSNS